MAVGQSGVTNSLDPRAMVAGYPAIDSREWRKASVLFRRLPELKRRIEELEARVAQLTARRPQSGEVIRVNRVSEILCAPPWRLRWCSARVRLRRRPNRRPGRSARCRFMPRGRVSHGAPSTSQVKTIDVPVGHELRRRARPRRLPHRTLTFVANYQAILGDELGVRSESGQLHPRAGRLVRARWASSWPACSITSRGI